MSKQRYGGSVERSAILSMIPEVGAISAKFNRKPLLMKKPRTALPA